jgi:galactokinase
MAIDRHVVLAADGPAEPHQAEARLYSVAMHQRAMLAVHPPVAPGPADWSSYVQGVVAQFLALGAVPVAFDAVVHSDLALGGGLSSSAALEVATATLLEALTGLTLDPLQKALLCQKAEHEYARVPCGIMDQCSSVMGQLGTLLLLDCRSRAVELVPLADPDVVALIANSNVKRELAAGEYAVRRRQCEEAARILGVRALRDVTLEQLQEQRGLLEEVLYRRAHHVISENDRTVLAADAVRGGDWETMGQLMYASHASLRQDFEVSCPELDVLVALAASLGSAAGVIGSRMTGGGFGGCTITLVRRAQQEEIARRLSEKYAQRTGRQATIFATEPVAGAHLLPVAPA